MKRGSLRQPSRKTPSGRLRELITSAHATLTEPPSRAALKLLHPFPAPMSPSLARLIIAETTRPTSVVLDPMAGSGTVLLASRGLGRTCYAFDIDPLARLMMRVAYAQHDLEAIREAGQRVLDFALVANRNPDKLDRVFECRFDQATREFIRYWFPARARRGLLALGLGIEKLESRKMRDVLALVLSRLIIAKTSGVSRAIDLPHTRPHRRLDKKIPNPLHVFARRLKEVMGQLEKLPPKVRNAVLSVRAGDARRLPIPEGSVDLVLTSSPYANAIDYIRAHKFSLVWMGYSIRELSALRAQMIGCERGEDSVQPEVLWLERVLPKFRRPRGKLARARAILRRYFYDMDRVLGELYRVLTPGGACVLVVGRSRCGGRVIHTPSLLVRLASRHGFLHLGTRYRRINPFRRSLPFPEPRTLTGPLSKRMAHEAIVCLGR